MGYGTSSGLSALFGAGAGIGFALGTLATVLVGFLAAYGYRRYQARKNK